MDKESKVKSRRSIKKVSYKSGTDISWIFKLLIVIGLGFVGYLLSLLPQDIPSFIYGIVIGLFFAPIIYWALFKMKKYRIKGSKD